MHACTAFASADPASNPHAKHSPVPSKILEREREWANFVVGVIRRCTNILRSPQPTPQSNLRTNHPPMRIEILDRERD